MSEALQYIYYIFDKLLDWLFNSAEFLPNVTIGWVIITIILFSMVIKSILNIPRSVRRAGSPEHWEYLQTEEGHKWVRVKGMR